MPILFRCIRCQHAVKANSDAVGKKMYCPVCYFTLTVPAESTIKPIDQSQLYTADSTPVDVREMDARKNLASLRCSICHTNIAVARDQVGKEIVCPECETKIVVPADIGVKLDVAAQKPTLQVPSILDSRFQIAQDGVYGLRDSAAPDGKTHGDLIPFHCKLCNTLMYAPEDQVGQELTCPDCETKTVVPPKASPIVRGPIGAPDLSGFEGGAIFGVSGDAPPARSKEPLVPVVCSLCGTRMYARESEIGGRKICPDCGRANEIKAVPVTELLAPEDLGESYSVNEADLVPPPRPSLRFVEDYRLVEGSVDKEHMDLLKANEEEIEQALQPKKKSASKSAPKRTESTDSSYRPLMERSLPEKEREEIRGADYPELPKRPYWDRLFVPLRNPWMILRTMLVLALGISTVLLSSMLPGLFIYVGISIGFVLFLSTLAVLSDSCQSLFLWTASGNDSPETESWPDFSPASSLAGAIWLFFMLILAATPGALLGTALTDGAVWDEMISQMHKTPEQLENSPSTLSATAVLTVILVRFFLIGISAGFFFPILYLSCMENGSHFAPFSKQIAGSFLYETGAWLRFYLATFFLAFTAGALHILSQISFWLEWEKPIDFVFFVVCNVVIGTYVALIYFRLLGRFAWVLEDASRRNETDDDV